MSVDSINAYTPRERVSRYDRDMAIMLPNRDVMVRAVVDALPFDTNAYNDVLDLGIGTGILVGALLKSYPNRRVTGVDGAESMLESAQERLAPFERTPRLHANILIQWRQLKGIVRRPSHRT